MIKLKPSLNVILHVGSYSYDIEGVKNYDMERLINWNNNMEGQDNKMSFVYMDDITAWFILKDDEPIGYPRDWFVEGFNKSWAGTLQNELGQ